MKVTMRDGSGIRNYKHTLQDFDRHDTARVYFRYPGRKMIRLRERPGTPEFEAEYQRALTGETALATRTVERRTSKAGSVGALVAAYCASGEFTRLDATTRRVKRAILDEICSKIGDEPVDAFQPRHIAALRDEKQRAGASSAGNARVKTLRAMFKWATKPEVNLTTHNPAQVVQYLAPKNPDGHHTWTLEEIEQYQARWPIGTKARLALDLFLYTGVRISDVMRVGPQMVGRGPSGDNLPWLHFTEHKNRNRKPKKRDLPILPILQTTIEATPSGHLSYLVTEFGRPYASEKAFGNRFKSWCRIAGLPERCTAHGMRKAGATIAVENGATAHQLMAIFGWDSMKQAELYTRKASRIRLVKDAMPLIELKQKSNETVAPFAPVPAGATISGKKAK